MMFKKKKKKKTQLGKLLWENWEIKMAPLATHNFRL